MKKEKRPVGRPTNYTDEMLEIAKQYAEDCSKFGHVCPTVVGLCKVINRASTTVYRWAQESDKLEFKDILLELEEAQHHRLVEGGLTGEFNSPIAKMMLTKHGYSDKQEVDQKVTGEHKHEHKVEYGDPVVDALRSKYSD